MKYLLILCLFIVGCGTDSSEVVTVKGERGDSGIQGISGSNGLNGSNGHSIVSQATTNPSFCSEVGGTEVLLALDINDNLEFDAEDVVQSQYITCNGLRGSVGATGAVGPAGTSCTVTKAGSVSTIKCGSATVSVNDGINGTNGQNASGIYITEVINPCGVEFNNEEVFLRLSTGRILGLYDGGPQLDRLALLAPGNYITTDATQNKSCSFTVTNDYKITNEVRH